MQKNNFSVYWSSSKLPEIKELGNAVARGAGSTLGDCNISSTVLNTVGMDHFLAFNRRQGILHCETGVSVEEVQKLIVPQGWFLPVVPRTQKATIGGMIATDRFAWNHCSTGSIGHHILQFELLRSSGSRFICSPFQNAEWFSATIGGLGLTGLITWVEIKLKPIQNAFLHREVIPLTNFEDFLRKIEDEQFKSSFEYVVAEIDVTKSGSRLGRGSLICGSHAPMQSENTTSSLISFEDFFYADDNIKYGIFRKFRRPFMHQYECIIPRKAKFIQQILDCIRMSRIIPDRIYLQDLGSRSSVGIMSFAQEGVALTLNYCSTSKGLMALFDRLDLLVDEYGGRVNPACDFRMNEINFKKFFPDWNNFSRFVGPAFSSNFWQRVGGMK